MYGQLTLPFCSCLCFLMFFCVIPMQDIICDRCGSAHTKPCSLKLGVLGMLIFESKPHTMFIVEHICTQTHTINSRWIQSRLPLAVHTASVYVCGIKVFSCSSPKWNKCKTHCLGRFVQTHRFTHKHLSLQPTSSVLISSAQAERYNTGRVSGLSPSPSTTCLRFSAQTQTHSAVVQHS